MVESCGENLREKSAGVNLGVMFQVLCMGDVRRFCAEVLCEGNV